MVSLENILGLWLAADDVRLEPGRCEQIVSVRMGWEW